MNTVLTKLSAIKRNPNNPRILKDDKFAKLTQSIKDFPQMLDIRPIVVNDDMIVLGGNMRLKACKEAGLKEVPVIKVDDLTEEQQREFIIKDNVGFGEWDWDLLANDWDVDLLDAWGLDIDFSGDDDNKGLTDEDDVPEVTEEVTSKAGDIWLLGKHRVMCGDSTSATDIDLLMNGIKPDLIHTDPPYGMNAVTKSGVLSKNYKIDIMGDDNPDVAKDAFHLIYSMHPDAKQIWWGANYYSSALPDSECWLVWDKNNGESDQTDCELAWANFRSVVRQFTQASEKTNRVHPTQKPVSLMEWIIKRFKIESKTIADYFGGSGSTLIAAEKHNIDCFIMEFDPRFTDVIVKRWQEYTGKKAIHADTGDEFTEMDTIKDEAN
jgi:16S rRNA G966 N2-methylase RsmD